MKTELLKQLKNELSDATKHFHRTELFKILKEELTKLGYWKNKQRGNPKKGYKSSPMAQKNAEIRRQISK